MSRLLCVLNFVILVTSNPLQGLTSCPVIVYQREPEVTSAQASNFNSYQQQNIVQNQVAPSYQTIPYLSNDQIRGLYLDKLLSNPSISSSVDLNSLTNVYDQNGYKVTRYVTNPAGAQPNAVNNYIIVPTEYIKRNQSIPNVLPNGYENEYYKYYKVNNHEEKVKSKREEIKTIDTNILNKNEHRLVCGQSDDYVSKNIINNQDDSKVEKKKRKSSKNKKKKKKTVTSSNDVEDNKESKKRRNQRSKTTLDDERSEESKSLRKSDGNSKTIEAGNKNSKRKKKRKSKKNVVESPSSDDFLEYIKSKDKAKDVTRTTADVEVDFDINEDCTCLANRKTRNNCCQNKNNYQQCYPRDFDNIVAYLNSLMSNPQFGANYFNPFGNFPYNLNYLYQMPQQYSRPNESNKKRKNKRKKEKSNKSDRSNTTTKPNSNKNQGKDTTSNYCEKVVELEPQFIEIAETNEPVISEEITNKSEPVDILVEEIETKRQENGQNIAEVPNITQPVTLYADVDSKESFYVAPVLEDDVPILNYNDILDDYYPDFTSDNIYLSKEDYDCNNFRDRHFYSSDNNAEMSRERRRYERIDGKKLSNSNDILSDEYLPKYDKNEKHSRRKDNINNIENSSEGRFRAPPPLEYPDFKTKMVNRDRFVPQNDIYYHPDFESHENHKGREYNYETPSNVDVKGSYLDTNKDHENEVETIFAHSKVVRYGARPKLEESSSTFDFTEIKKDDRNLFSNDGETTVIIARSLGYPEDYW